MVVGTVVAGADDGVGVGCEVVGATVIVMVGAVVGATVVQVLQAAAHTAKMFASSQ
jgi:hypothetical protein